MGGYLFYPTIIFPSGNILSNLLLFLRVRAIKSVMGPTLPMNIVIHNIAFDISVYGRDAYI